MNVELKDEFRGGDSHLISCIEALISMSDAGALVPHGIGGHARSLLSAAAVRLAGSAEIHRMQIAAISTAAAGYWKEGDSIHPDYVTAALKDVAGLYAKYAALAAASKPAGECTRTGGCVCGGDTESVRRGCGYWQERS